MVARLHRAIVVVFPAVVLLTGGRALGQEPCLWQQLDSVPGAAGDEFGFQVGVDGDVIVVGAPRAPCTGGNGEECGAVHVYRRTGLTWALEQVLVASDAQEFDFFGYAAAVSGDRIVSGAFGVNCPSGGEACGAAYVFRYDGGSWVEEQKLTVAGSVSFDRLGLSVAIDGSTVVLGTFSEDCAGGGVDCGAAHVFERAGTSWSQTARLISNDVVAEDQFGSVVSVSGDVILAGAFRDSCPTGSFREDCGSAYVFRKQGGVWVQEALLRASDRQPLDWFGYGVSVRGDVATIGAPAVDCLSGLRNCGAAYVFRYVGSSWVEEVKVRASDAEPDDQFGEVVAIDGNHLVVGSRLNECADTSFNCGSAYVFSRHAGSWSETVKLIPDDIAPLDLFGAAVAVRGNVVVAGASRLDDGPMPGTAYVFALDGEDCDGGGVPDVCESDADGDGVIDACDQCAGFDDTVDADGDGMPNGCDVCAGGDDAADADGDDVPDACDLCPTGDDHAPGALGDDDADGVRNCADACPGVDDALFAPACANAIPAASTWGLMVLGLALLVLGKVAFAGRVRA